MVVGFRADWLLVVAGITDFNGLVFGGSGTTAVLGAAVSAVAVGFSFFLTATE